MLLLLPLGYYLSYLVATPVHDFRFLYPATVTVQCLTLSAALLAASPAFAELGGAQRFLSEIATRERDVSRRLFAGHPDPFGTGPVQPNSRSR